MSEPTESGGPLLSAAAQAFLADAADTGTVAACFTHLRIGDVAVTELAGDPALLDAVLAARLQPAEQALGHAERRLADAEGVIRDLLAVLTRATATDAPTQAWIAAERQAAEAWLAQAQDAEEGAADG